jgi:cellulose synthase/poly-beta-1,6-N-acetylglucosamine synthase-like glycosyltransferase
MVEILFWVSLIIVLYVYIGYLIIAAGIAIFLNRGVIKGFENPFVTVLIAAFNEQEVIEETIQNKLNQNYPKDRLEILVVSDSSSDKTDDIVRSIKDRRVRIIRQEPRAGKTSALNLAVPQAKGEIVIFSDANSLYAPNTIQRLVRNFSDPSVGYVTGKMIYTTTDGTVIGDGCSAYMRYENRLREIETRLGSIIGVDGGVDAVRKRLYQSMANDQLPDFVLPLKVVAQGYRVVYEPEAILWENSLKESSDEYRMRVRVSLRALWALFDMRKLLWLQNNFLFSWQLWSHKVLRYLCFLFLIMLLYSNFQLLEISFFYQALFCIQVVGYIGAIVEPLMTYNGRNLKLLRLVRYFVLINFAAAHAFIKFLAGKKQVLWTPRKG